MWLGRVVLKKLKSLYTSTYACDVQNLSKFMREFEIPAEAAHVHFALMFL